MKLKNRLFTFLFLIVAITETNAQLPTILRDWAAYSGEQDSTFKTPVVIDPDGNVYVATYTIDSLTGANILITKYNSLNDELWQKTWTGFGNGRDQAADICFGDEAVYICGITYASASNNLDYIVLKMDAGTGNLLWSRTYNGTASGYDVATGIVADRSGVCVTGTTLSAGTGSDFTTIYYDSQGTQKWIQHYDYRGSLDIPFDLVVNETFSEFVVVGAGQQSLNAWDYVSIIYDTTGLLRDSAISSGTSSGFDCANGVTIDKAGNILITGSVSNPATGHDIKTVKLKSNGNLLSDIVYDRTGWEDIGYDILADTATTDIYVCGKTEIGNQDEFSIFKFKDDGSIIWQVHLEGSMDEAARKMCFDAYGNIIVTGEYSRNSTDYDFLTIGLDLDGNEIWRDYFDGPEHLDDKPTGIAADNNGNIYVTGQVTTARGLETVTIRYRTDFYTDPVQVDSPAVANYYYPNSGQIADVNGDPVDSVDYYTLHHNPQLYFGPGMLNMVWSKVDEDTATADTLHRVDVSFLYSNNVLSASVIDDLTETGTGYLNYFLAHCPEGITNVFPGKKLLYPDVWPGIDVIFSSNNAGIKMYFVCEPWTDPGVIGLLFNGQDDLQVLNNLRVSSSIGEYEFDRPKVYQLDYFNNRIQLPWQLSWNLVGPDKAMFTGWNSYDHSQTLVVEVGRINLNQLQVPMPNNADWGTFLGGTGKDGILDNFVDESDNYYTCGFTNSSSFPGAVGTTIAQNFLSGGTDAFVSRFNSDQVQEWSTYYGGSSNLTSSWGGTVPSYWNGDDVALGISVDDNDNAYIVGFTSTDNFPLPATNPVPGGYFQNYYGGEPDGFIVQLSSAGSRVWATRYGGNTKENIHAIIINEPNDYFMICGSVMGTVEDPNTPFFPYPHGFISSASCQSSNTCSHPTTPLTCGLPLCNSSTGYYDNSLPFGVVRTGFIAKFNLNTKELLHSTLFGGTGEAWLQDLAYDQNSGNIAVIGRTTSTSSTQTCSVPANSEFPLCDIGGYFQTTNSNSTSENGFIAQFQEDLTLKWSTFFGACDEIIPTHLAFNSQSGSNDGDLYVTGYTKSASNILASTQCIETNNCAFPLCNFSGGFFSDHYDHVGNVNIDVEREIFLTRFNVAREITWSTFYGGSGDDFNDQGNFLYDTDANADIAIDLNDNVYLFSTSKNESGNSTGDISLKPLAGYFQDDQNTSQVVRKQDAILAAFSPTNQLLWSTYIGGEGHEFGTAVSLNGSAFLYVAGIIDNSGVPTASSLLTGTDLIVGNEYVQPTPPLTSTDAYNGFIWRFDMRGNPIGIEEYRNSNFIKVFPNPSRDFIEIEFGENEIKNTASVEIIDVLGKCVYRKAVKVNSEKIVLDIRNLSNALYTIHIFNDEISFFSKIIIAR